MDGKLHHEPHQTGGKVLSADERRHAQKLLRSVSLSALNDADVAEESRYWARQRALLLADLEIGEADQQQRTLIANELAIVDLRLAEVVRESRRRVVARRQPGYPRSEAPPDDLGARFRSTKYADLLDIAQTLTGRSAVKRGAISYLLCPFHEERTPSLAIYPPGRGWYCFGCHKGGDAVTFVAELRHCSAVEALLWIEQIADTYPDVWEGV